MQSLRNLKFVSRILIFALLHLCWLASYGWAEMVPTESTVQSEEDSPVQSDRQRLFDLLQRERVQKTLHRYGISQEEAVARINSLSDQELSEVAGKLDRLKAGGHDAYGYDDDDDDWILELTLIILLIGLIAVAYFLGLLAKAVTCPFFEDCTASFLFRPWWVEGPSTGYPNNAPAPPINPPAPPVEPPPPTGSSGTDGIYIPGGECDPREQACEWSVR